MPSAAVFLVSTGNFSLPCKLEFQHSSFIVCLYVLCLRMFDSWPKNGWTLCIPHGAPLVHRHPPGAPFVASLLLVARPGAPSSVLFDEWPLWQPKLGGQSALLSDPRHDSP